MSVRTYAERLLSRRLAAGEVRGVAGRNREGRRIPGLDLVRLFPRSREFLVPRSIPRIRSPPRPSCDSYERAFLRAFN